MCYNSVAHATPGLIENFTLSVFEVTNLNKEKKVYKIGYMQPYTLFTPAKDVLLNWFLMNENHKQRTEKT